MQHSPASLEPLRAVLERGARRLRIVGAANAAAIGLALATAVTLIAWWRGWSAVPVAIAGAIITAIAIAIRRATGVAYDALAVASAIERHTPMHNVLVTATELAHGAAHANSYVTERVVDQGARLARDIDTASVFPLRRPVLRMLAVFALWCAAVACAAARVHLPRLPGSVAAIAASARIAHIDAVVTPPAYMARKPSHATDPASIEAPAGSVVTLRIRSAAAYVAAETTDGKLAAVRDGDVHLITMQATADGYIAIESGSTRDSVADRRMIGLRVTPDAQPRARITTPGRDLHLSDSTRVIDIAIEADDDNGLASLALRYTRVSGSGEQYAFSEGMLPVTISRTNAMTWKARATLRLTQLTLNKGDMVVYRAAVTDARPGATAQLSDAFIVEITAPGDARLSGFAADDEDDRYALSQEMVIRKTQQLIARAAGMQPDSLQDEAMLLAAEQRSVRAEFVFMMGGELAEEVIDAAGQTMLNEEAEAAGESDLAAGRAVNRSRIALVDAIRAMSQANTALTAQDLSTALAAEKRALASLQDAFSHTRYILRGLTRHERLDMARRLTGDVSAAAGDTRASAKPVASARITSLRSALAAIATLSGSGEFDAASAESAARLGVTVARLDAASPLLARAAQQLVDASNAMNRKAAADARARLGDAARSIAAVLRDDVAATPPPLVPARLRALDGALSDALRDGRVRR
jgi:hypothetical protein